RSGCSKEMERNPKHIQGHQTARKLPFAAISRGSDESIAFRVKDAQGMMYKINIARESTSSCINPFWDSLRPIWEAPTCVWVCESVIIRVAKELATDDFPIPSWREPVFPEQDRDFFDFIAVGNSINFAFTDFKTGKSFVTEYRGAKW